MYIVFFKGSPTQTHLFFIMDHSNMSQIRVTGFLNHFVNSGTVCDVMSFIKILIKQAGDQDAILFII